MRIRTLPGWTTLFALVLLAPLACGGDDGGSPTGPTGGTGDPVSLTLADTALAFAALGDSAQLAATVLDADGNEVTDASIAWASTDTGVATVSASGWVVAIADGTAQVVASSGTLADTASVAVAQAGAGVTASPGSLSLHALGDSVQLTASVRDANDNEVEDAAVGWASSDTAVATVSDAGWVVAEGNGTAEVVVSAGARADTVAVEVAQVAATITVDPDSLTLGERDTVRLAAVVADSNGVAVEGADITWSSADEDAATVDDAGLVRAVRAGGETTITATAGALSDNAAVSVLDQIAFQRGGDIYLMNEDGVVAVPLVGGTSSDTEPVWSPDGSKLAFITDRDGNMEIYVVNADGTGLLNVSNGAGGSDFDAAWSPDGNKLAFRSNRGGNYEIYVVNADSTGLVNLTTHGQSDTNPAWSPDGSKIAFASTRDGNSEIYVMNADGSAQTRLTNDPDIDLNPVWSPDGSKILFTTDRDGTYEIYAMNPGGTGVTNLTNAAGPDEFPVWSPDGTKIAFRSFRDGDYEIYVMNADGTGAVNLSNDAAAEEAPSWSADGSRVLFVSARDGNSEIYVVDADGGTPTNLTNTSPQNEKTPAWRPKP